MLTLFDTVHDLASGAERLRARRYGVIEVVDGQLRSIRLRPFPKRVTLWEARLLGEKYHRRRPGNRCLLYYNQPYREPVFLTLQYIVSARDTTFATCRTAVGVLDEIARLKRVHALLCDVATVRISDRLLSRWGWEPHAPMRWHRNFIKRFEC